VNEFVHSEAFPKRSKIRLDKEWLSMLFVGEALPFLKEA